MNHTFTPYYPCEFPSLGAFLRRIAIDFVRYGHFFYVAGSIPAHKDPRVTDRKLIQHYCIPHCRVTRMRARRKGEASLHYARLDHDFLLIASEGTHRFFQEEAPRDIRQNPYEIRGYSIGVLSGKPCVMIAPARWKAICRQARGLALHNIDKVTAFFTCISPFSFPGILRQRQKLLREVNRKRKRAGLPLVTLPEKARPKKHH